MTENEIATIIVDVAYKIHQRLGPGLMESVYESTIAYELGKRVCRFEDSRRCRLFTRWSG